MKSFPRRRFCFFAFVAYDIRQSDKKRDQFLSPDVMCFSLQFLTANKRTQNEKDEMIFCCFKSSKEGKKWEEIFLLSVR